MKWTMKKHHQQQQLAERDVITDQYDQYTTLHAHILLFVNYEAYFNSPAKVMEMYVCASHRVIL